MAIKEKTVIKVLKHIAFPIFYSRLFTYMYISVQTKVLIVTGNSGTDYSPNFKIGKKTEIIDMENPEKSCLVKPFPEGLFDATGGLIGDNIPYVCGGCKKGSDSLICEGSKACYTFQIDGTWREDKKDTLILGRGKRDQFVSGSVVLSKKYLVIAATGLGDKHGLATLNFASPQSNTFKFDVKTKSEYSCIVPWDENTLMIIGGYHTMKKSFFIHMGNKTSTKGPELNNERYYHACHEMVVKGEEFIVVTGGNAVGRSTEYLSKKSYQKGWKKVEKGKHYTIWCHLVSCFK